jgi:hypothetical protein
VTAGSGPAVVVVGNGGAGTTAGIGERVLVRRLHVDLCRTPTMGCPAPDGARPAR